MTEYREYITQCPKCGVVDCLEVITADAWFRGLKLEADGFDIFSADEIHTEEELVRCTRCENHFDLSSLKYDEENTVDDEDTT